MSSTRTKLLQTPIVTNWRASVITGGESKSGVVTLIRTFAKGHLLLCAAEEDDLEMSF